MKSGKGYALREVGNNKTYLQCGSEEPVELGPEIAGDAIRMRKAQAEPHEKIRKGKALGRKPNLMILTLNMLYPDGAPETERVLNDLVTNPRKYRKGDADISH
jgi:hypothetical protein